MEDSVTPSLLDLYKKASNPKKTDVTRIHQKNPPPQQRVPVERRFVDRSRDSGSRRSSRQSSRRSREDERSEESSRRESEPERSRASDVLPQGGQPAFFTEGQRMFAERNQEKEKSVLLNEYNRLRSGGSNCVRNLTMNDDIADIRWELNCIKVNDDYMSTVSVMKDMIKLGTTLSIWEIGSFNFS